MIPASQPPSDGNVTPLFAVTHPQKGSGERKGPLSKIGEYPLTIAYIAIVVTIVLILLIIKH